jgi:hypothetical protein
MRPLVHPEPLHRHHHDLVLEALHDAFPCAPALSRPPRSRALPRTPRSRVGHEGVAGALPTPPVDIPRLVCYNPCMLPLPSCDPRCQNTLHPKAAWCAGVPRYGLELTQGTWQLVPATERATHCRVCGEVEVRHRNAQLAALRAQRPRPA